MNRPQIILILGCQRSGTSWLCTIIGAHSQINMRYESIDDSILKYAGKKINGNKLVAEQIGIRLKANIFGHLLNRISMLTKYRLWPVSYLNIMDYIKHNTKVIIIERSKNDTLKSIYNRRIKSRFVAKLIYNRSIRKIEKIKTLFKNKYIIQYEDLLNDSWSVIIDVCNFIGINAEIQMLKSNRYIHNYQHRVD